MGGSDQNTYTSTITATFCGATLNLTTAESFATKCVDMTNPNWATECGMGKDKYIAANCKENFSR